MHDFHFMNLCVVCSFSSFIVLYIGSHGYHSDSKTVDVKDNDDMMPSLEQVLFSARSLFRWGLSFTLNLNSVIPIFCLSYIFPFNDVSLKNENKSVVNNWRQWAPEVQLGTGQLWLAGPAELVDGLGRGRGGGGSAGGRRGGQGRCEGDAPLSVLDPPDGLDLRSLGVVAKLTVTLVLSSTTVALHDVLVATVTRVLVAHEAVTNQQKNTWHENLKNISHEIIYLKGHFSNTFTHLFYSRFTFMNPYFSYL